nr:DNA translocase FtsK [Bacillus sp. DNRA2]
MRRFRPHSERTKQAEPKVEVVPETIVEKPQQHTQENQKPKKEKIRYGPFRPTEIPSPIYGYERPQRRQTKVIEHELTGFFDHIPSQQDEEIAVSLELVESEPVKQYEVVEEVETSQVIEAPEDCAPTEDEEVEIKAVETQSEVEGEEIRAVETSSEVEEVKIKADETPSEVEGVIPNKAVEAPIEVVETSVEVVETPIEVVETATEVAEKPTEVTETPTKIIEFPIKDVAADVETSPKEESVSKSHIPFNVIMLKQDRQKLSTKNLLSEQQVKKVNQADDNDIASTLREEQPKTQEEESEEYTNYQFPSEQLLTPPVIQEENGEWLMEQEDLLNRTLTDFNVGAKVVNVTQGPSVTRFEVQPDPGVKVNKITNLQDDIKLSLAAKDIRIEAPIPGKHTIGIEVPNSKSRPVFISEIIDSPEFNHNPSPLTAALGLDISGKPVVTDLRKMPHGLIAGATGSGKSVCINSILTSLLYKADPRDVKLLLIDPKMVELAPYNHIPHLVSPVITDVKAATAALKWAVEEMERRYELFVHTGVREISRFNEMAEAAKRYSEKLPYILIVIDELADLMMVAPGDVEEAICRIAQKARACGIHLIIATQRPSVDVITGLIKANIPTRIAFSVSSQIDSRTIIDIGGAEKLLGRGDMLFLENGTSKPVRLQGTFISDTEIDRVVEQVRSQAEPDYLFEQGELLKKAQVSEEEDELYFEACEFIVEQGVASTSSLQRRFKIGYNRAARLIDMMQANGYISEARGSKPRDVLITEEELDSINSSSTIN